MMTRDFILKCEKDLKEQEKDIEYYKNKSSRLEKQNKQLKEKLKYWVDIHTDLKKLLEETLTQCVEGSLSYRAYKTVLNKIEELENIKK